jgi:hypothetical protein
MNKIDENITVNKWIENDKYFIRKLSGGICDFSNAFNSFCIRDMNISTDINGSLLTYDEETKINIINDEKKLFNKIITINLKDNSKDLENANKTIYEQILNKIISKLSPYMIYKEFLLNNLKNYII